jgi:hypothetical protein
MITSKPSRLRAGDSVAWVESLPGFSPADGWTLAYSISNPTKALQVQATPLGGDFQVSISSAVSATLTPGSYTLIGYVSKAGQRHSLTETLLTVIPDVTAAVDRRSQAERTLEAINALLEGKASDDQQMIQYAGRTLSRYTFAELTAFASKLSRTVARERARKRGEKGFIGVRL